MQLQNQPRAARRDPRILFFQGFLRRPGTVGSVIPSSRYLERRVIREARLETARLAVELGPGTGGTTRAILRALPADAKLLSIEINPDFLPTLRAIADPRLVVHEGSAAELAASDVVADAYLGGGRRT